MDKILHPILIESHTSYGLIKFIIDEKIFNLNLFLDNAGKWNIPYKEDIVI